MRGELCTQGQEGDEAGKSITHAHSYSHCGGGEAG